MANWSRTKINSVIVAAGCAFLMASAQTVRAEEAPYKVEGNKVDSATFKGYQTYKRQRCETCHGQTGEGSAAFPNLLTSLKTKSKEEFKTIVLEGKNAMPAHKNNKAVVDNIDGLYAYLKGRSDGAIPAGELEELK
jgi:mono/diheme cytochrome c family protein